jgi:hypothetical protein
VKHKVRKVPHNACRLTLDRHIDGVHRAQPTRVDDTGCMCFEYHAVMLTSMCYTSTCMSSVGREAQSRLIALVDVMIWTGGRLPKTTLYCY